MRRRYVALRWAIRLAVTAAPLIVVALIAGLLLNSPLDARAPSKLFLVRYGQSFSDVKRDLVAQNLVSRWVPLGAWASLTQLDRRVQPGEYEVSAAQSPLRILDSLVYGRRILQSVTIAEGLTSEQILPLIEKSIGTRADDLRAAAADSEWLLTLGLPVADLEGYLHPETYLFEREAPAKRVLAAMVNASLELMTPERKQRADALGFSWHQVLTLASIIEAEAAVAAERPRISAVYHNRLVAGWLLQADPTVARAIRKPARELTLGDLAFDSPYNTYRYPGLPPGPICSPGEQSIDAALWPLPGCFDLYFVAQGDGTHDFSRSLAEHNQARQRLRDREEGR